MKFSQLRLRMKHVLSLLALMCMSNAASAASLDLVMEEVWAREYLATVVLTANELQALRNAISEGTHPSSLRSTIYSVRSGSLGEVIAAKQTISRFSYGDSGKVYVLELGFPEKVVSLTVPDIATGKVSKLFNVCLHTKILTTSCELGESPVGRIDRWTYSATSTQMFVHFAFWNSNVGRHGTSLTIRHR